MRAFACLTISISVPVPVFDPNPIPVLVEILEEHFTRHFKGGKSTKVIVFTQLRATVRAIVADLAYTKGVLVTILRLAQGADRLSWRLQMLCLLAIFYSMILLLLTYSSNCHSCYHPSSHVQVCVRRASSARPPKRPQRIKKQ
jgi:hypothetical protein